MTTEFPIHQRIQRFRQDVESYDDTFVVQRHITFGESYILADDQYFELKREVSVQLNIHPNQVVVVGSAKLGFSIAPQKRYRHFGNYSDLDLAIVSNDLFDSYWLRVFEYRENSGNWAKENLFKGYLFRGWVRPDCLPATMSLRSEWFEYFRNLTATGRYGPYTINAGIYQSWAFLEKYQARAVAQCRS